MADCSDFQPRRTNPSFLATTSNSFQPLPTMYPRLANLLPTDAVAVCADVATGLEL
jgi:hypothetical protein